MIVERDAELQPLPDDEAVTGETRQPPAANDTVRPEALGRLAIVPEANAEDGKSTEEDARQPATSRLPVGVLLALATLIGLAGAAGTVWSVRHRRALRGSRA